MTGGQKVLIHNITCSNLSDCLCLNLVWFEIANNETSIYQLQLGGDTLELECSENHNETTVYADHKMLRDMYPITYLCARKSAANEQSRRSKISVVHYARRK